MNVSTNLTVAADLQSQKSVREQFSQPVDQAQKQKNEEQPNVIEAAVQKVENKIYLDLQKNNQIGSEKGTELMIKKESPKEALDKFMKQNPVSYAAEKGGGAGKLVARPFSN